MRRRRSGSCAALAARARQLGTLLTLASTAALPFGSTVGSIGPTTPLGGIATDTPVGPLPLTSSQAEAELTGGGPDELVQRQRE